MKRILRCLFCITCCWLMLASIATAQIKPVWKFSVLVAVEKQTAAYYEQKYAKPIATIVREQLAKVNANFNSSTQFKGTYSFSADSIYVIEGSFQADLSKPHPGIDYKVVIDGYAASTSVGGWSGGANQLIYHKWMWNENGGPFEQFATDGFTQEFAQARGATDIYGMKVDSSKNSINGKGFVAINSIMNSPFGNITWDEHTVNLLNRTAGGKIVGEDYITSAFPKNTAIRVRDAWGYPVKGINVDLFPVSWYSYTVSASPKSYQTNQQGVAQLTVNPFGPGTIASPWHIQYPNFLVGSTQGLTTTYTWLPLYEVQNHFFKYGADSTYYLNLNLPALPASIKPLTINDTLFCVGQPLLATSTPDGSFSQINTFSLQLSDSKGSFQNPTVLKTSTPGNVQISLNTTIPNLAPGTYKIRIASSEPVVFSNELTIRIKATPAAPLVTDLITCQNATASVLTANGQNLRWYTNPTGGTGTLTPPPVNTTKAGDTTYYVSQTAQGCESPRAALKVKMQALPTLSVTANTSLFIGEQATLSLKFTGQAPYQYQLSNGLSGTASKDTTLVVSPKTTTTYTVQRVSNVCGIGQAGTSATVTVQLPQLETLAFSPASYCGGSTVKVGIRKVGRFATGTNFKLQMAKSGTDTLTYVDLPVVAVGTDEIAGTLPAGASPADYRVRAVATHPSFVINGSASPTSLTILPPPTAILTGGEQIFGRDTAKLSVVFKGQAPWTFSYRSVFDNSPGTEITLTTSENPYQLRVSPIISTTYFLTSVRNACGNGSFSPEGILIKVVPLLSTADPLTESRVEVFPVPTHATLTLRIAEFASQKAVRWELYNLLGQVVMQEEVREETSVLSLENQPAGLYLLRINIGDQVVVRRVVKQ